MDRNDIIDLLTIVQAGDNRTVGQPEVNLWHQLLGHLDRDDCTDAIMAHRREQPGQWLEPGHILQRVRAVVRDRYERSEPGLREQNQPLPPGAHRDRYGYVDKSSGEEDVEYPAEWTVQQRLEATWESINRHRDSISGYDKDAPGIPAADDVRGRAMAAIRSVLNKNKTGMEADGTRMDVSPVAVRCPFCGSPPAEPCTAPGMPGRPREVLKRTRAHPSRIEAAAVAMGMTKQAAELLARGEQIASIRRYRAEHPALPPMPRSAASDTPQEDNKKQAGVV